MRKRITLVVTCVSLGFLLDARAQLSAPQSNETMVPTAQVCESNIKSMSSDQIAKIDRWHLQITDHVFQTLAVAAEREKISIKAIDSACSVEYWITSNGRIEDVKIRRPSSNPAFDKLVVESVKELEDKKDLIKFPPELRSMRIRKISSFGDRSTIHGHEQTGRFIRGESNRLNGM